MSAEQVWEETPEPEEAQVLPMRRPIIGYPKNVRHENLHRLFTKHPRLRGHRAAAMVETLYEGVTWNA